MAERELQHRKLVEPRVDLRDLEPEPGSHSRSGNHADDHDQEHQLEVMHSDGEVAVPERLERRDLVALQGDDPGQDDIQQEGCHGQKDRGDNRSHPLQLPDLVGEKPIGNLITTAMRAKPAERLDQGVDPFDHLLFVRKGSFVGQGECRILRFGRNPCRHGTWHSPARYI